MARIAVLLLALLVAACSPAPDAASPALWRVDGPGGQRGWLFGTIHALDRPALWRSAKVGAALDEADLIVVEIADQSTIPAAFARRSRSPGLPPLSARIDPTLRPALMALLAQAKAKERDFAETETWAAALSLARAGSGELDPEHGIDRAVIAAASNRPVIELEGADGQLAVFDTLPEREQRDLLEIVLRDAGSLEPRNGGLAAAWRKGDMATIERETRRGLLADPELRDALFTQRNRRWADRIAAMMAGGHRPFVAVGGAHMAGAEGLPVLLEAKGLRVTRVQ